MTESTKINFRCRNIPQIQDITDLVDVLFPNNRNQQYAAALILLELKSADRIVPKLGQLESKCGVSRRTLQRVRAKLARLGIIEHVSWMNSRYGGQEGWKLSSRMSTALRLLADKIDDWRKDNQSDRIEKELTLVGLLSGTDISQGR